MFLSRLILLVLLPLLFGASFQKPPKKTPAPLAKPTDKQEPKLSFPEKWLEATAQKGDDLAGLLGRYDLYEFECNAQKFLSLNKLGAGKKIASGKTYKLPVLLVKYNGKSIRTTLKIKDLEFALRVEAYNKATRKAGLREDNFVESKNMWVPWHEFGCPAEGEVAKAIEDKAKRPEVLIGEEKSHLGNRVFPIFGPKYQKTPLLSRRLRGKVFYVVSGHGGPDVGAEGKRGGRTLCEDEYAYDVALRLVRLLIGHGATAFMITRDPNDGIRDDEFLDCDKDETVWGNLVIPAPQKKRLFQRTDLINEMTRSNDKKGIKEQTILEIHVDSRTRSARTDVFFYYRRNSSESEELAKKIHNTFKHKYMKVRAERHYTGTVTPRDLHTLRETVAPRAVYIELGNIRNVHDQERIVRAKNRQVIANWLAEAIF